jgi:uncharacterized membrane protein
MTSEELRAKRDKDLVITTILLFILFVSIFFLVGVTIYFLPKQEDIAIESVKAYTGCNNVSIISKSSFYNGNAYLMDVCGKQERFILYNDGHLLPR